MFQVTFTGFASQELAESFERITREQVLDPHPDDVGTIDSYVGPAGYAEQHAETGTDEPEGQLPLLADAIAGAGDENGESADAPVADHDHSLYTLVGSPEGARCSSCGDLLYPNGTALPGEGDGGEEAAADA